MQPFQPTFRWVPVAFRDKVKENLLDQEKIGIIRKVIQPINWIGSTVIVGKPGKIRTCLNPRDLNKVRYQMPTLEKREGILKPRCKRQIS